MAVHVECRVLVGESGQQPGQGVTVRVRPGVYHLLQMSHPVSDDPIRPLPTGCADGHEMGSAVNRIGHPVDEA